MMVDPEPSVGVVLSQTELEALLKFFPYDKTTYDDQGLALVSAEQKLRAALIELRAT
jgi:hypothetical protein